MTNGSAVKANWIVFAFTVATTVAGQFTAFEAKPQVVAPPTAKDQ